MSASPPNRRPVLVVRLSNWVGDVVLTVPVLRRLASVFELRLVGRRWMPGLLAGYGWSCHPYPARLRERVALLRRLRGEAADAAALCFPTSLSSALEFRLAGLPAWGYAEEGRSPLLRRALRMPPGVHMADHYAHLADALLRSAVASPPPEPGFEPLRLTPEVQAQADAALQAAGLTGPYTVVCPLSSSPDNEQGKEWPHFGALVQWLRDRGQPVVACPGPGEDARLAALYPDVRSLPGLGMDVYGGIMARARLVVANDTGPGHLAAALGVPTVSVLGPSDPVRWAVRGPRAVIVHQWPGWPSVERVAAEVDRLLQAPAVTPGAATGEPASS